MSTDYALGTVAIVTNKYGVSHPAIRTFDPNAVGHHGVWRPGIADVFYEDYDVTDVRPLLLIDPQDPESLAAALTAAAGATGFTIRSESAREVGADPNFTAAFAVAVLRHLANPKPKEPVGIGAVVREGVHTWVLARTGYAHPWRAVTGDDSRTRSWASFSADVEVLSPGYNPEAKS